MQRPRPRGIGETAAVLAAVFLFSAPAAWAAEAPSLALVRPGSPWLPPGEETGSAASGAEDPPAPPANPSPRATKAGLRIGAITGAIAGAALFPLGLAVGNAVCEYDCGDYNAGSYVLAGVVGAGLFGLAGAGIGALIGSAFPGEGAAPQPTSSPPSPASTSPRHGFGSLTLTAGVDALTESEYTSESTTGLALQGSLLANFVEGRLSLGVESGYSWVANGLFTLGGVARFVLTDTGLRPYGVFRMGWDSWAAAQYDYTYQPQGPDYQPLGGGGASLLAAGIGAGLTYRLGSSRTSLQLESRYNWPLQHIDEPGDFKYVSVTFGPRFSW